MFTGHTKCACAYGLRQQSSVSGTNNRSKTSVLAIALMKRVQQMYKVRLLGKDRNPSQSGLGEIYGKQLPPLPGSLADACGQAERRQLLRAQEEGKLSNSNEFWELLEDARLPAVDPVDAVIMRDCLSLEAAVELAQVERRCSQAKGRMTSDDIGHERHLLRSRCHCRAQG